MALAAELFHEVAEELDVGFGVFALEGVETGGLAAFQRHVGTAAGPDEDFGAAVFVEEEDGGFGVVFLHLAEQKVDEGGFTGTGFADDHGVGDGFFALGVFAFVGGVEVEIVRLAVGGLQNGNALPPRVLVAFAGGEVVQWAEA